MFLAKTQRAQRGNSLNEFLVIGTRSYRKVVLWWFHSALCIWGRRKFYHRVHRVWVMFFRPAFPSVFLCGDENIPHLRNAADPRNALVFPFSHSSKPLCAFATSRDAFFVLFVFFVVVAIIWNLARRAAMSRKNGGVTFPRQAAKRAKANRERNDSVGQRWKL